MWSAPQQVSFQKQHSPKSSHHVMTCIWAWQQCTFTKIRETLAKNSKTHCGKSHGPFELFQDEHHVFRMTQNWNLKGERFSWCLSKHHSLVSKVGFCATKWPWSPNQTKHDVNTPEMMFHQADKSHETSVCQGSNDKPDESLRICFWLTRLAEAKFTQTKFSLKPAWLSLPLCVSLQFHVQQNWQVTPSRSTVSDAHHHNHFFVFGAKPTSRKESQRKLLLDASFSQFWCKCATY